MEGKIDRSNVEEIVELTGIQKGMLYYFLKEPEENLYNVQLSFSVEGILDVDILKQAIHLIQSNNEALRSVFRWEEVSKPLQVVLKECPLSFSYIDASDKASGSTADAVREHADRDWNERFDLRELPLRMQLIRTAGQSFVFNITYHHILHDGWSNGILLGELFSYYKQLNAGETTGLISKPSYKIIYNALSKQTDAGEGRLFWREYLKDYNPSPLLVKDHLAPHAKYRVLLQRVATPARQLTEFSAKYKVTKAAVIYAAYGLLLHKYTGASDIVFGTTVSTRAAGLVGIDKVMGNFINVIPIRMNHLEEKTLLEVVEEVGRKLLERNRFNGSSSADIREIMELRSSDILYDSELAIENYPMDRDAINGNKEFTLRLRSVHENTTTPLVITVFLGEEVTFELTCKENYMSSPYMAAVSGNLLRLLGEIVGNSHRSVGSLTLAMEGEETHLHAFNETRSDIREGKTVLQLIEEQAQRTPDRIALTQGDIRMTYRELRDLSDRIAAYLHDLAGMGNGDLAGIKLHRGLHLVPLILGVLKTGAAYVPIDPAYPEERMQTIVRDAAIKILITETSLEDMIVYKGTYAGRAISDHELAYVLYTSGSTGNPKGVMISHKALANYVTWAAEKYVDGHRATFPLYTSVSFDLTVTSIFVPLITGNRILVYQEKESSLQAIEEIIADKETDIVKLTPSHLKLIRDSGRTLSLPAAGEKKIFIVGGEDLPAQLARDIYNKFEGRVRIYNEYGPTEATVGCMLYEFDPSDTFVSVPIGEPAANMEIYLLDEQLALVAAGVTGEIYIAGTGLADGYLRNSELTEQRFIPHLFTSGQKMYRTGDLAVRTLTGKILFKGRTDDQVKIRGFRVELGEVQGALMTHASIKDALVLSEETDGDAQLIAFYVAGGPTDDATLKDHLLARLPTYMIPAHFTCLEAFPLTVNGKPDKKALLALKKTPPQEADPVAPSREVEEKLARIWSEVLKRDNISIHKNFFDAGGDSLKLIRLAGKIKKIFNRSISVNDFFIYPTIYSFAGFLSPADKEKAEVGVGEFHAATTDTSTDIAIIGMACRFPEAAGIDEFRKNLQSGRESIIRKEVPGARKIYAKGFLKDYDLFDGYFFDYIPTESASMDPQIRIFHECCWEALESAGYNSFDYEGSIGLYGGASPNPYFNLDLRMSKEEDLFEKWVSLSYADKDFLCPRVSYKMDLRGPSISIATACSTSLVAVDMACNDLLAGKCDLAMAGAVSVTLHDEEGYIYHKGMILSPDGRCRAFDKEAAGTVGGNGAGVVVLKKLKDALRDGDVIHAVIKGTATNNDGLEKVGFTAPGIEGQARVISMALAKAGIVPGSVSCIEAHGTGTSLGDPVEIAGLTKAFASGERQFCAIGSVKTNIGHLDAAAGIAGLIKTVLALQCRQLFPSLHYKEPNPGIDLANTPFYVNANLKNWEDGLWPRRAGVSSFGIGGTNAHVILEEAPEQKASSGSRKSQLLLLSGRTPSALKRNIENMVTWLKAQQEANLPDVAYTLQVGRKHFTHRKMVVCEQSREAIPLLEEELMSEPGPPVTETRPYIVLMLSATDSPCEGIYGDLYAKEPLFRQTVDDCFEKVSQIRMKDPYTHRPSYVMEYASFIMEYALVRLLAKWGLQADTIIGHGIGEHTAACLTGTVSLEVALQQAVPVVESAAVSCSEGPSDGAGIFFESLENLLKKDNVIFIGTGVGDDLTAPIVSHPLFRQQNKVINLLGNNSQPKNDVKDLLMSMGRLWQWGVSFSWKEYYSAEKRRRVTLPTYSFERTRFPVATQMFENQAPSSEPAALTRNADISQWLYVPCWKNIPGLPVTGSGHADSGYLIFADDLGVGSMLASRFGQEKRPFVLVKRGSGFLERSETGYEIDPDREDHYERLFTTLSQKEVVFDHIIYAWTLTDHGSDDGVGVAALHSYCPDLLRLAYIARAVHNKKNSLLRISLLTNDLQQVTGNEKIAFVHSPLIGLMKVIPQEYPAIYTGLVDILLSEWPSEKMGNALLRELSGHTEGRITAIRNGQRWERSFEKIVFDPKEGSLYGRPNGRYLITGGLGELGFALAKYLLKTYDAKIVLVGRTPLPEKDKWDLLTAESAADDDLLRKIDRMRQLEGAGGEIAYLACDAARKEDMARVIAWTENKFGSINGVIHAAGVVRGNSIDLISKLKKEEFETQFNAKLLSLDTLYKALSDKDLDFCLVASSISAVLGGMRFGAYAPVNTAVDHYVGLLRSRNKASKWCSVNFDGLAFDDEMGEGIRTQELHTVFERLIALCELPQIVVSVADLDRRLEKWITGKKTADDQPFSQPVLPDADNLSGIEDKLVVLWQEFFGMQEIVPTDDFFELGGDSLKVLTMIGRIRKKLGIELSATDLFEYPSIKALGDHIRSVYGAAKGPVTERENRPVGIPVAERQTWYPLSSVQRRLYFLYEIDIRSTAYNTPLTLTIQGDLDKLKLESVIEKLIRRHESLRTCFETIDEQPRQRVEGDVDFGLEYYTATGNEHEIINGFIRPFELHRAPLIRAGLISCSPSKHILVVDSHHIVMDGISKALLIRDFISFFKGEELPELRLQYKDFAQWQQSDGHRQEINLHKDFWIREFPDNPDALELPADFARPAVKKYKGGSVSFTIPARQTALLKKLADEQGVTLFMLLTALYNILLAKLTNREDIVIGAPISGRQEADLENITGMFVNTLPLRNYPHGELIFTEFLAAVKEKAILCFDHQAYPYETLIDELKVSRHTNRNPLFDVWFSFENFDQPAVEIPGLSIEPYSYDLMMSKFDLALLACESGDKLSMKLEYSADLFRQATIEGFSDYLRRIIDTVITEKHRAIAEIGILSEKERDTLLHEWNATKKVCPVDTTIIDLFEAQVQKTPENRAYVTGDSALSYRRLKEISDRIAAYLRDERKVVNGDLIGIMLEREEYLVPFILGVLKAGGVFVPIDLTYPAERRNFITEDARLKLLVTRARHLDPSLPVPAGIVDLDGEIEAILAAPAGPVLKSNADGLAYVIYTSGSTGRPKGVAVSHAALANYIDWAACYYVKGAQNSFPLYTSISFDLTITSIFTPLITGAAIVAYREEGKESLIEKVFADGKGTIIKLTPSHLKILRDSEIALPPSDGRTKILIVGGEDLESSLAKDIYYKFEGKVSIYNEYGPTEATVGCMIYPFNPEDSSPSVPIGRPINNMQIYLLDKFLMPVPAGVPGELFISGSGLAKGYLFREDLTGEKFIDNPFVAGAKMYRTGDIACRLSDGNLLFRGRIDDQIKLNGFRVEPAEIESRLQEHEFIKEAVVMARERDGIKQLVAWYVAETEIETAQLRSFLAGKLPDHMVPLQYVRLNHLPLTPNGKLDKMALPEPALPAAAHGIPETEIQKEIIAIWAGVLNLDPGTIGIHTNFYDLGGNSIKLIRMINRVNKHFNSKIQAAKIFELPVISLLADFLNRAEKELPDQTPVQTEDDLAQMNEAIDIMNKI